MLERQRIAAEYVVPRNALVSQLANFAHGKVAVSTIPQPFIKRAKFRLVKVPAKYTRGIAVNVFNLTTSNVPVYPKNNSGDGSPKCSVSSGADGRQRRRLGYERRPSRPQRILRCSRLQTALQEEVLRKTAGNDPGSVWASHQCRGQKRRQRNDRRGQHRRRHRHRRRHLHPAEPRMHRTRQPEHGYARRCRDRQSGQLLCRCFGLER